MRILIFLLALLLPELALAVENDVPARWVQLGPGGAAEARLVVFGGSCPDIVIDGKTAKMHARAQMTGEYLPVCSAPLPAGTKSAAVQGRALPLPAAEPTRILLIGDTGCRIKGSTAQDCNDPKKWPFLGLAEAAARLKPDLVIHVGDYLYRENACPAKDTGCAGTPFGDNWPTWNADFFTPATPLLAAAPWLFVRGNHEDCNRAGFGWSRLLDPYEFDPHTPCITHRAPWRLSVAGVNLMVMDDADAPDRPADDSIVPVYRAEIAALQDEKSPTWLLLHRPIWGAISGPLGIPVGGNATLIDAVGDAAIPKPVTLMLSGHIHAYEAMNYASKAPPQIVAGTGGDNLDTAPSNLKGTIFQGDSGVRVLDGITVSRFGYQLMTKTDKGWTIDLFDQAGAPLRQCVFAGGRVDCPQK